MSQRKEPQSVKYEGNIPRDSGRHNRSFWSLLTANSPEWADNKGWNDVDNYSTIQTAVVNNELYLLARGTAGMITYKFNTGNNSWSQLVSGSPEWADNRGWDDVTNYSTIQTAVVNNELYLLARANAGIFIRKFNPGSSSWSQLATGPEWSDDKGWNDVANYSTIQTAVVNNELYLLARANAGIFIRKFNPGSNSWSQLATGPEWSDDKGWDDVANYSTIQTAVVNNELYLLARANAGIFIRKFNPGSNSWSQLATGPEWSDDKGWDDVANYSTIQTAVVNNELYLLARANAGIFIRKFNIGSNSWSQLATGPEWSDDKGWNDVANYSTIQTAIVNNELYLLARANAGILIYKFNAGNNSWSQIVADCPRWADVSGWGDVTNYSTIQTASVNNELYLLARGNKGISTWKFNATAIQILGTGDIVGFATADENGGCYIITGGTGGPTVAVSNYRDLETELTSSDPKIVKISGTISGTGSNFIHVESDKTIVGIGSNTTIAGFGFRIKSKENIVIRNLNFINAPNDAIRIDTGAHHIWIDHNSLSNAGDGLIDITHFSSWITISWNRFFSHQKTMLIGASDNTGPEDIGKLKVTCHHNWFDGTVSRHPRARFDKVHVFNNFYDGVTSYGVASTMDASVLVEANYFKDVNKPTDLQVGSREQGKLEEVNNVYDNSGDPLTRGTVFNPRAYYSYTPDNANDIASEVAANAGAGKLTNPEVWN